MEALIAKLLASDSETISQATAELVEAYKRPETVLELCGLIVNSSDQQIRQYSCVLLRKRLSREAVWLQYSAEIRFAIKQGMLTALMQEKNKSTRNGLALLVGLLLKHESTSNSSWIEEVITCVLTKITSPDPEQSEMGALIFAALSDASAELFVNHMGPVFEMFNAALTACQTSGNVSSSIMLHILLGMGYLVPFCVGNTVAEQTYTLALPSIVKILEAFAMPDKSAENFQEAFDILESLVEHLPKVLTTHMKLVVEFCLAVASNTECDTAKRVKVVSYLGWMAQLKKNMLIKLKLVEPITQVLFQMMMTPPTDETTDDMFDDEDSNSPISVATQTMDNLALHIPADKLFPSLLKLMEPALQSDEVLPRRAALLTMAMVAEGCSKAICDKYLSTMLNIIKVGITNNHMLVRNAAFFALGQFAEHLQPEIAAFAPEIMPILFEFLQQVCVDAKQGVPDNKHVERMFYALEIFCENLEVEQLKPHLSTLMERLFETMNPTYSISLREMTLRVISSAAVASKEHFMPYFDGLVNLLRRYLVKSTEKDILELRSHAIDTLASVALNIGKENFLPLAADTMQFALTLLEDVDDPDDLRAIYGLLSAMAEIYSADMGNVFPKVMERLYDSVLSSQDIMPVFRADGHDEDERAVKQAKELINDAEIDIEDSNDEDDDEDDDDNASYDFEDAYLDEKEEAIGALAAFAAHCGPAFMPYIEQSYQNVYKVIDHPAENIRKAAIECCVAFIVSLAKNNAQQEACTMANLLIPKLERMLRVETEMSVALPIIDGLVELVRELKALAVTNDQVTEILLRIIDDTIQHKLKCQFHEQTGDEEEDDNDDDSAYEFSIVESAGDLLPALGKALPADKFFAVFDRFFPMLMDKLKKTKSKDDDSGFMRYFVFGVFADCFQSLGQLSGNYFDILLPFMLRVMGDGAARVRQNAVYGLGELVLHSGPKSYSSYPQVLSTLSEAVTRESKPGVLDNICSAIARLILNNHTLVPLAQVLPVLFQYLPLREDFAENRALFECLKHLFINARDLLLVHYEQMLLMAIQVLYKKEYEDNGETHANALALLKEFRQQYPQKFDEVLAAHANPEISNFLATL